MSNEVQLSMSIMDAWMVFNLHCQSQRYRYTTIVDYKKKLLPFFRYAINAKAERVSDITSTHIRNYLIERQKTKYQSVEERSTSGNYVHGVARCIRAFFNFCVAEGWLEKSPMASVKMPRRPKKILDALTVAEIKKIVKGLSSDRDKALFFLLLDTGMRAAECTNLRIGDIEMADGRVLIKSGKGEKDRYVYFGAKTARFLLRVMGSRPAQKYVWLSEKTGKPLTLRGLSRAVERMGEAAGVKCHPHKIRRTFAITSLRSGMNIYTLARLMGHEDITVLKPYLKILNSDLSAAQSDHGVVDNL